MSSCKIWANSNSQTLLPGKRDETHDEDGGRSKSARVSISHLVETREKSRPWTSQTTREESLKSHRPKSASFGPPKPAWHATKSPRRCQSAKSQASSTAKERGRRSATILERTEENETEESDITSTPIYTSNLPSTSIETRQPSDQRIIEPVFPHYPIYPDVPLGWTEEQQPSQPRTEASTSKKTDPAVPLILAIKDEIRRFEKVKATDEEPNATKNP